MAEAVCSAVTSEAARKLSSSLLSGGEDGGCRESYEDRVERLELAVLKLQTIVAASEDFQITLGPLLQWRAKLKRVAKEGKRALRSHKKQIMMNRRKKPIWEHMARAARRLVPYFSHGAGDVRVERFERLADSAGDFVRFVERGGGPTKRSSALTPPLARSLGAGETTTEVSLRVRGGTAVILLQPWWLLEEHDEANKAACLWISYDHDQAWEKSLKLMAAFYLSDSAHVLKIVMDCVDVLPTHFCAARAAMKELVAEMFLYGASSSPAPSPLYARFVRGIQNSHRYGFAPTRQMMECSSGGPGAGRGPNPILLACAHFYVMPPVEKSNRAPLELVWHRSRSYLPNKLSEQHEMVGPQQMDEEVIPKLVANGFDEEDQGAAPLSHERQWWCPQSSTRLLAAPLLSPPRTLLQWCAEQKQGPSTNVRST